MAVISIKPGSLVCWQEEDYEVVELIDLKEVLASSLKDARKVVIPINQLRAPGVRGPAKDLVRIPDCDWGIAKMRYRAIQPLLGLRRQAEGAKEKTETKGGGSRSTLYRWRDRFLKSGTLESLLPVRRGVKKGSRFLAGPAEHMLERAIEEVYLTNRQLSVTAFFRDLQLQFRRAGVAIPHINTVRKRIAAIPAEKKTGRREGKNEADQVWTPNEGSIVAEFPLAIVQIDHTPLDIILVDDEFRLPIGRPWLTLAFDVCTRMVLGFYLSMDPPGALSVGLCMLRAILPKDEWIQSLGLSLKEVEWPCWGLPASFHMDNAREFRGEMLARACEKYQIGREWRPVKKPNWGGNIERYLGSVAEHLKILPGATSSGGKKRARNSEGKAIFALHELEKYLVLYFCGDYHRKEHSALKTSPLEVWKEAFRTKSALPRMETDVERLRMDFMPFALRTIGDEGVLIDWVHYFDDVLRPYVNSVQPGRARIRRKFIFRRDPRDISVIYFYDEDNDTYHPIPYRNRALPAISLWELKAARKRLQDQRKDVHDEEAIFAAREDLIAIVESAAKETKRRRRETQRRRGHVGVHPSATEKKQDTPEDDGAAVTKESRERTVEPFEEISA